VSAWSDWFDITADTNAPGSWDWAAVAALGANIEYSWGSGPTPLAECGSVELRVTYAGAAPVVENKQVMNNYYY